MQIILTFAILNVVFAGTKINTFNDVDICISLIQKHVKGKATTKALSGLVGIGWDDLTNSPTLPILSMEFKKCQTDNSNSYLLPDNVFAVPIENADVEKTSSQIDSFKSMMESSSNKIDVSASATVKGVSIGGSFSSENQQSKESFEKQTSIMLLNKIHYSAFELMADENKGFDKYFLERVDEIAEAVNENKMLWGKFLAETFISDFGTHLVNKATAGAEIIQETYISKSETYKGEKTMDAYKAEVSIGFKAIAKVTIGYESKKEKSETHTTSSVTTKSILRTRGGPDISRISGEKKNASMLYVENLVGLKQSGKYIFEVISAIELPKYSSFVKYTVKELIQNATEDYYSYNYRPGCMDNEHENFNKLANVDDGSCLRPNVLFANGGLYQICTPISAKTEFGDDVYFSSRCDTLERMNPKTKMFTCPDSTDKKMISSIMVQFNDRKMEVKKEQCGFFSFIFGCSMEMIESIVYEKFQLDAFWCPRNVTMTKTDTENEEKDGNELDKITSHKTLSKLNNDPELLKLYFNEFYDPMDGIVTDVCPMNPNEMFNNVDIKNGVGKVATIYDSMTRAFSEADETSIPSTRYYSIKNSTTIDLWIFGKPEVSSQTITYTRKSRPMNLLEIKPRQFNMLRHYPAVLKKLLPILDIPPHLQLMRNLSDALVNTPKLLEQLFFKNQQTLYNAEPEQIVHFGGAFKSGTLNPFTGTFECPPYFQPLKILTDFNLCLSTDSGRTWSLRLGGFYNCSSDFKLCPRGYSAYLGTVFNGCAFHYCIRFHKRDNITPAVINRPPYSDYKLANAESMISEN
uniref:Macrophage-expressed gene 1 protein n=1 Tax=Panagrolaimus sp. ES5 TaxID=591445 RepID=A0AC34FLX3_9BILA